MKAVASGSIRTWRTAEDPGHKSNGSKFNAEIHKWRNPRSRYYCVTLQRREGEGIGGHNLLTLTILLFI